MPDDGRMPIWPEWPRAEAISLARYVTSEAGNYLPLNGINPHDALGEPDGRRTVTQAIYDALKDQDIRYALEKYHPSEALQYIRTPAEVLTAPREGTCLDLAVLFCGLCLTYELLPLLIVMDGHALAAVSLNRGIRNRDDYDRPELDLFVDGPMENVDALRELIRNGSYLAVECTGFAHSESLGQQFRGVPEAEQRSGGVLTFAQAVKAGQEQLDREDRPFKYAIDIAIAHYHLRIEPYSPPLGPAGLGVATPGVAATELPPDVASFVGHQPELDRATQALSAEVPSGAAGVRVINGMAGVGKTVLAVHAAYQLADRFPDGQIFLRLYAHTPGHHPVKPADALTALLLYLEVPAKKIPQDVEARASKWRDTLAGKKILLLLDDALDTDQVRPLLPGDAGTLVLITSRHRLTRLSEATPIPLEVLEPQEAAQLFVRLAGRPGLEPSDADVAQVVELCGRLPLAISLVAGQLKNNPWTCADQVRELRSAADRAAAIYAENDSVAAAFELSYTSLTEPQRRLFCRLGLHPGTDVDVYSAAALDGTDPSAASRLLQDLFDCHLIDQPSYRRYRFHDLIREYARARAASDLNPNDGAVDRLLVYYLHAANAAGRYLARHTLAAVPGEGPAWMTEPPTREAAIEWLKPERLNLVAAATERAVVTSRPQYVIGIAAAMVGFLRVQGFWDQALTLQQAALAAAQGVGDRRAEANAFNDLGGVQQAMGRYQDAAANHNQALALYRDLEDPRGEADTLSDLSIVQRLQGDYAAVTTALTRAVELYRGLGDQLGEANACNDLGIVQRLTGDYTAAADNLNQALALHHRIESKHGEASALKDLGMVQRLTNDYASADDSLTKALELYRGIGDRNCESETLNNVGELRLASSPADARAQYEQALRIAQEIRAPLQEARALEGIGKSLLQEGQTDEGTAKLRQALVIYQRLKAPDAKGVRATLRRYGPAKARPSRG